MNSYKYLKYSQYAKQALIFINFWQLLIMFLFIFLLANILWLKI